MKIRNGFVSNSSSSSFVVAYKKLDFSKPENRKESLLSSDKVRKLKSFGFKYIDYNNPYFVGIKGFEYVTNLKKLKSYNNIYFGYDVICNQDDVIYFLLTNKIPFVALCHYEQELVVWDGKNEYFYKTSNPLETLCKKNGHIQWNFGESKYGNPPELCPVIRKYKISEWLKNNKQII